LHISSPPMSGKSSLCDLLVHHIDINQYDRYLVPFDIPGSENASTYFCKFCKCDSVSAFLNENREKLTFLIIDDAQCLYEDPVAVSKNPERTFWGPIKAHEKNITSKLKIIVFATHVGTVGKESPYAFSHRLYADILLATDDEQNEIFDDYDSVAIAWDVPKLTSYLRAVATRLTRGHLGLLRQVLNQIWKMTRLGEAGIVASLLGPEFRDLLGGCRVRYDPYKLDPEQQAILLDALDGTFNATDPQQLLCGSLVKAGYLFQTGNTTYQISSPIIRRSIIQRLCSSEFRPTELPPSIYVLVKRAIQSLKPSSLKRTLGRNVNGSISEDTWQKEFYPAVSAHIPKQFLVSPDVGAIFSKNIKVKKRGKQPSVDFYIDGTVNWLLEFVAEGSILQKHVDRFQPGGSYNFIPTKQWLIVDFRNSPPVQFYEGVVSAVYSDDFKEITLISSNKREEKVQLLGDVPLSKPNVNFGWMSKTNKRI